MFSSNQPSSCCGWWLAAAIVGAVLTSAAHAHHGEPPPSVRIPVSMGFETAVPARWSWLHWWEANRDAYLRPLRQADAQQLPDPAVAADLRRRTVESLTRALEHESVILRAEAAMALGRMQAVEAVENLRRRAESDPSPIVVRHCLTALGLLDHAETGAWLTAHQYRGSDGKVAGLTALGLMSSVPDAAAPGMVKLLDDSDATVATTAAWIVQRHPAIVELDRLRRTASQTANPWLASEALLALGRVGDDKSIPLLSRVLRDAEKDVPLASARTLLQVHQWRMNVLSGGAQKITSLRPPPRSVVQLGGFDPNRPVNVPGAPSTRRNAVGSQLLQMIDQTVGVERIYLARLRISAAMALGMIEHPAAVDALLAGLGQPADEYSIITKGFIVMSLAQQGSNKVLQPLMWLAAGRDLKGQPIRSQEELEQPVRGYAALALGIYARPYDTPQGPADRPGFDQALMLLAERLGDDRETQEVRAATAVALGLSRRTQVLPLLMRAAQNIKPDDELLAGYVMLARGMLGDVNVLPVARAFLLETEDRTDMNGILARRAAVLGLGMIGSPQVVPVLTEAWHLNHYVNREVAMALSFCGAPSVAEPVLKLLSQTGDPAEAAFMARVLGELYTPRPARMMWLTADANYTVKNTHRLPYQAMANEFLYNYLIAAFGQQWW